MASALACPQCSDPSVPPPGARVFRCVSCKTALYVEHASTPHVMVERKIGSDEATEAVKNWMHGVRHRELLALRAKLGTPRLIYLPFARIDANVVGWIFGARKHYEDHKTFFTDEEVEIGEELHKFEPLSDVGTHGVERLPPLDGVELVPFIPDAAGEVIPAIENERSVEDRAHETFLTSAHANKNLSTITGEAIQVIGARDVTIHYPFWRIDYTFGRKSFHVVVDARTGEIAYGRAPGSTLFHSAFFGFMMPVAAAVMLVATIVGGLIIGLGFKAMDIWDKLGGAIVTVGAVAGLVVFIAGAYLATVAHRGLQSAGEVESGFGAHAGSDLFDVNDDDYRKVRESEQAEVEQDPALAKLESAA